ncbi:MAG: hypothetical protein V1792_03075 [Pseudomonadota bacterium]
MTSRKSRDVTPLMRWFCLIGGIVVLALVRPGHTARMADPGLPHRIIVDSGTPSLD